MTRESEASFICIAGDAGENVPFANTKEYGTAIRKENNKYAMYDLGQAVKTHVLSTFEGRKKIR